jgi:HEAT repeat protein
MFHATMLPLYAVLLIAHAAAEPSGTAPAAAKPGSTDAALRSRVETLLGARHGVTPAQWAKLDPAAIPLLEEIAREPGELPSRRARAVEGLGALRAPGSGPLFVELAQSSREPLALRSAAMRSAAQVLEPGELVGSLRPLLEAASSVQVRAAAADVLARHAPDEGCAAVRGQAARESRERQARFERALRRCPSR